MILPEHFIEMRRALCAKANCTASHDRESGSDFSDPCAACPDGHWNFVSYTFCGKEFPSPDTAPISKNQKAEPWPILLLPLKLLAKPDDRGAGDIIARVIGPIGGDAFKTWYKKIFGKDCGCGARQETLNARFPFLKS